MGDSGKSTRIRTPSAIAYLFYADVAAVADFLVDAFGFTKEAQHAGQDGEVGHAQLSLGDSLVMLGRARADMGLAAPGDLAAAHSLVLAYVGDVDAHYARAKGAGATIWYEPADMSYGQREYGARDPEGGSWSFATILPDA